MNFRIVSIFVLALLMLATTQRAFSSAESKTIQNQNVDCSTTNDVSKIECEALVALYNATDGANWNSNFNWLVIDQSTDVCDWYGIQCSSGAVIGIDLDRNNLAGSIPEEIGNLSNLQFFSLVLNSLNGDIPEEIGTLADLQTLNLMANSLSGGIPIELKDLTNLTFLRLSNNQLTGTIPTQIGDLVQLKVLGLDINQLEGSIPASIGNLVNLNSLFLAENQLSGQIPAELSDLSQLNQLYLSSNQLSGSIPAEFGNLDNLSDLFLHSNMLEGPIPTELGDMASLTELVISNNRLTGTIPSELSSATNLRTIYLNSNLLSGSVPTSLSNLSSLSHLYLNNNQLTGEIPAEYTDLNLFAFWFFATDVCVPANEDIRSWLTLMNGGNGTQSSGLTCGSPAGSISGQVTGPDSSPLANIDIHLLQVTREFSFYTHTITTTDSSGNYSLNNLGEGVEYQVKFVDPTDTYSAKYYDNVGVRSDAETVSVVLGNTTTGIDAILGTPARQSFELNVQGTGNGSGTITSMPEGILCDTSEFGFEKDCSKLYLEGAIITLTVQPSFFSSFAGWQAPCSGTGSCVLTITESLTATAVFSGPASTYGVSVFAANGASIRSDLAGINCGFECNASFEEGTTVTFSYSLATDFSFDGWTGDCAFADMQPTCELTMDSSKQISINTTQAEFYSLDVNVPADGITVYSDLFGIDFGNNSSATFQEGSMVTLFYNLEDGYQFDGWSGDCSGSGNCTLTMDGTKTVTATASVETFPVSGKVVDENDQPVSGVTLTATEISTPTRSGQSIQTTTISDENGEYVLQLPEGKFTVSLSKAGVTFNPSSFEATVGNQAQTVPNVVVAVTDTSSPTQYTIFLPMIKR